MSKTIPSSEVRKIINEHKKILSELKQAQNTFMKLEAKVVTDVDGLLDEQAMELVSQIPVEELNRNKSGIRIKALKSAGYENVAQVHKAHVMKITNIEGIGEDSACTIKAIAADYFKKARENSHIRLDFGPGVDLKKQLMVKELILTLYKLLLGSSSRINCNYVLFTYKDTVEAEMAKLGAITGLRRIFCSAVKREMAEDAYDYLSELLDSEYTEKIKGLQHADYEITMAGSTQAVDDYKLNPIPYYTLLDKICPGVLGEDNYLSDLPDELIGEIGRENLYPEGLRCSLRRYQEWGVKYILHQEKVLLGDEMGLGKTVQAIAAMVSLRNIGETHFMVICPASVLTNWCREIEKHSTLKVVKVHGPGREEVFSSWMKNGGVAVTTYESTAKLKPAFYFHFCMLVVDEYDIIGLSREAA